MNKKKMIIMPQLNNCGGDLNKKWFVFYSFLDTNTGKLKRFRCYKTLHQKKTVEERSAQANKLILDLTRRLKAKWNPFTGGKQVVYTDNLQYHSVEQIRGNQSTSLKNFNYFASIFVSRVITGYQEKTIKTYISRFRIFNTYLEECGIASNHISEISNKVVIDFFVFLITEKKHARRTTSKYKQLLHNLFDWIVREGEIDRNPIINLPKNNRVTDCQPRAITRTDLEILKPELQKDPQLWLASLFVYYCFLRPRKELRFMRVKDIDFVEGRVYIPAKNVKIGKDKLPVIPDEFLRLLRTEFKIQDYNKEFFVFGKYGEPGIEHVSENNISRRFNKIRDKLNFPKEYKFYSFKHTGNAALKRIGVSMQARQSQNGHQSEKSTEIYSNNIEGFDNSELRCDFPTF